jgi:hypothetical protein
MPNGLISSTIAQAQRTPRRNVEGGEKAIAGGLHLASAEAGEIAPHDGVVSFEQMSPPSVPERCRYLGRTDDIGEQDRNQNTIDAEP